VRPPGTPPEIYDQLDVSSLYVRIAGLGRSGPIRAEQLESLVGFLESYTNKDAGIDVTTAFDSPSRWQDARKLKKLVQSQS
jgi:hypothetical protein